MAYLRPNLFERMVFNRLASKLGMSGTHVLALRGSKSGATVRVPVIPVDIGGARYIVSTRGEAAWVRNLRAAGNRGELSRKGKRFAFVATEIPVQERAQYIAEYRKVAGKVVERYWKALPDPADHPVFRLEPA